MFIKWLKYFIRFIEKCKTCNDEIIHVVWGIPKGHNKPAVLVTAYKPNPKRWNNTFTERLK